MSILASVGIMQTMFFGALETFCFVAILCGTNNINKDPPYYIIQWDPPYYIIQWDPPYYIIQSLIAFSSVFKNQSSNRLWNTDCKNQSSPVCGILPHGKSFSINRLIINEVNNLLKSKCFAKKFHFINQSNE